MESLKFSWEDFQGGWGAFKLGQRPIHRWSCGNRKNIKVGDRVFLMRLGKQEKIKGIIASGYVTKPCYEAAHWGRAEEGATTLYINFEPDALLNPLEIALLDP